MVECFTVLFLVFDFFRLSRKECVERRFFLKGGGEKGY